MTRAWVPNRFRNGTIVDGEDVNDNLRAIARDVKRSTDLAYNYCTVVVPFDGMTNADPVGARTIVFRLPDNFSADAVDVVGVELSLYAAAATTWTLTAVDALGRTETIPLATAGVAVEAVAASTRALRAPITFTMSASGANTIARGSMVLTLRANRHVQDGETLVTYVPHLVDATTSSAGSVLDEELLRAEAAVLADTFQSFDLRCECILARGFASPATWSLPSGAGRSGLRAMLQVVATAAVTTTFTDGTNTLAVAGTGTANTVLQAMALASDVDDPIDTADDLTYTLTPSASVALAYAFLWWS